jgi:hypothetical protein
MYNVLFKKTLVMKAWYICVINTERNFKREREQDGLVLNQPEL